MATKTKSKTKARSAEEVARSAFEAFQARDADGTRASVRAMVASAPDLEITLERIAADDRPAVTQGRGGGTFTGEPSNGIDATGRHMELRVIELHVAACRVDAVRRLAREGSA